MGGDGRGAMDGGTGWGKDGATWSGGGSPFTPKIRSWASREERRRAVKSAQQKARAKAKRAKKARRENRGS